MAEATSTATDETDEELMARIRVEILDRYDRRHDLRPVDSKSREWRELTVEMRTRILFLAGLTGTALSENALRGILTYWDDVE